MLDILKTEDQLNDKYQKSRHRENVTYNKLAKVSKPPRTANDKATVRQMLVKAVFCHMEFGISAERPNFTWCRIQKKNAGTKPATTQIKTIVVTLRIAEMSALNTLEELVILTE